MQYSHPCLNRIFIPDYFVGMIVFIDHGDSSSQRSNDVCDASPGQGNSDDSYDRIYTTSRPTVLKNVLEELNQAQRDSVIEMGLGGCCNCRLLRLIRGWGFCL